MTATTFYDRLLDGWCRGLPPAAALVCAFDHVRDIPYGSTGERNPEKIVKANLGSCSGKHVLLNNLFRALGYRSRVLTCLHWFDEALPPGNDYPERLREIVQHHKVPDFHHFVKIEKDGREFSVDATWDAPLSAYGFPANVSWDGDSDTIIGVKPVTFYPDTEDIIGLKKRLIAELPPEEREIRAEFMRLLTDWLGRIRAAAAA